jgi:hypothetical protein
VYICTEQLPPGGYPIAIKYISYQSFIYYLKFLSGSFETEFVPFIVVLAVITKSAQIPFSS